MCTVISVVTNKGGAGKTTTVEFLSQLLVYLNKKVLVIDLDPQNNLSKGLASYVDDPVDVVNGLIAPAQPNVSEIFKHRYKSNIDVKKCIYATPIPALDIIPSSKRHNNTLISLLMNNAGNTKIILKRALAAIKEDYDYVLIDNAPANDIITINSLFCADLVIAPIRAEGYSMDGSMQIMHTISEIKEEYDYNVPFGGIFFTQIEENTNAFKRNRKDFTEKYGDFFYNSFIRKDTHVMEINSAFTPILDKYPNTNAVFDYAHLLLEMSVLDTESGLILERSITAA